MRLSCVELAPLTRMYDLGGVGHSCRPVEALPEGIPDQCFVVLHGGHKPPSVFPEAIASPPWWECNIAGFSRHCVCTVPCLAARTTWPITRAAMLVSDLREAPPRQDVQGMGFTNLVHRHGRVILRP
jgi:hypothetical protein